jgi:hemoglobin/transferrin/lactoferrin receptor protein
MDNGVTVAAAWHSGFRAPNVTDLGTLGLSGSGFEISSAALDGIGAWVGTTADANARPEKVAAQILPERSRSLDLSVRYQNRAVRLSVTGFASTIENQIVKRALLLPPGVAGSVLAGEHVQQQFPNGAVLVSLSPNPVLIRSNGDDARLRGVEARAEIRAGSGSALRLTFTSVRGFDARTGLPPETEGGIPPAGGSLSYTLVSRRFAGAWLEPYIAGAVAQTRLSTLDLQDRRIGAARSVGSIARFFRNGATARGIVRDGVLVPTGETLPQVQARILGPGLMSGPLYPRIPGYTLFGVRAGFEIRRNHRIFVEAENLTDRNYRGVSWGVDGPGRGLFLMYSIQF